jgi:hypothetical protein
MSNFPMGPHNKWECKRCREPGVAWNDDGEFLCEDCMLDEAIDQMMPAIVAGELKED